MTSHTGDAVGTDRVTVVRAEPHQVAEAAAVLARAFADDPVTGSFVAFDADRRLARLAAMYEGVVRAGAVADGVLDLAVRASDGRVVGVAAWEAPQGPTSSPLPLVAQVPRFVRALGLTGALRAARHRIVLGRPRVRLPHWYLADIGVVPTARGLGVGAALLGHRLDEIDRLGAATYLESSNERNRTLYRRHGFVELGAITGLPHGRPAAMWRPARAVALPST